MYTLDKSIPSQLQGINKDLTFKFPNQVTFALNAIKDSHDGGKPEYQSEPGNTLVQGPPDNLTIIGTIYGQNDEIFIFSSNNGEDEIGLFKEGIYLTLVNTNCLEFSTDHPITGEYRIRNGCERILYWSDGINPDRWFNVDRRDLFWNNGVADDWNCNAFRFNPVVSVPNIEFQNVNDFGGSLPAGSYYFQIEVLDKNQNIIYKTDISPQVPIYDESQSSPFNQIDGALNSPQYDVLIGGVPTTSKSITLKFSNLSTQFPYLRVKVARQIAGNKVIDAHAVASLIQVSDSEISWTYTGYNVSAGDYPVDYSEMLIDTVKYASSYVMEQVQNRLVRANLTQIIRDYSGYQQTTRNITAKWIAKEVPVNQQDVNGNPKYPGTYWTGTTFQGDEVYMLGVQYLHDDGSWSPAFPLIPNDPQPFEEDLLTVVSNSNPSPGTFQVWESDVEHIPDSEFEGGVNTIGAQIKRWKVFNTAYVTSSNTTTHPYNWEGEFGYYEGDNTYADIVNCDNELIWGDGIDIETKIRHFRFPDRRLIPIISGSVGEYVTILGVKFDNITYPDSSIIGHRFLYAKRDEVNKTVLDSGWISKKADSSDLGVLFPGSETQDGIVAGQIQYSSPLMASDGDPSMATGKFLSYNSAQLMYNDRLFSPSHIKNNNIYLYNYSQSGNTIVASADDFYDNIQVTTSNGIYLDSGTAIRTNHKVLSQIIARQGQLTSASNFVTWVANRDFLSTDNIIYCASEIENYSNVVPDDVTPNIKTKACYAYKKSNNKVFENIYNVEYDYINFNPAITTDSNEFYNGDCLISLCAVTRAFFPQTLAEGDDFVVDSYAATYMFQEQQINSALRIGGTTPESTYCKLDGNTEWILGKIATRNNYLEYELRQTGFLTEYYSYNKDYDKQNISQVKVPLPITFNYCDSCIGRYTNRIIFSPKSFDEEIFDLYRINQANDYIDIPGHRGRITGLKYINNILLVHCEDTTFILQPNPQQIQTDQNTAYIGTGDFLSIPPYELLQVDTGFGGCQSKQSMCDTPFGHCWADQKRGEILNYNREINKLSDIGLQQWFRENLPSETQNAIFQAYNYGVYDLFQASNYPHTATTHAKGYGVILYYDPRFKRLIVSKKDYLPIQLNPRLNFLGDLDYSFEDDYWQTLTSVAGIPTVIQVNYGNSSTFENKSWTLSFSFELNSWTSWHSYRPWQAFSDSKNYYTIGLSELAASRIYKHLHFGNYQKYYNVKYDFIIEWMNFDIQTDRLYAVHYTGYTYQWNTTTRQWNLIQDSTFNRMVCYNQNQSTGLQTLTYMDQHVNPYLNVSIPAGTKYVIKTDNNYKISGIYDMSINSQVTTKEWAQLKLYPSYIDQVVNPTAIDFNKPQYEWGDLWDKYVITRLFFKPSQDYKKVVILSTTNEQISIR